MRKFVLVPAAFLILAAVTASCGGENEAGQKTATYKTFTVDTASRTIESSYSATIRGRQDIDIYPQVSGTITTVCVTEGQKVKKGELLFIIDQVPYKAALMTAEANVAAAEAGVATAQLTYDSKVKLYEQKVISQFELQSAENALLTAKATLAQCEAQRVNAANNLSYTEVSSPADGVVGTIPYRQGALVSSAMAQPLTTISDNSQMYVYFSFNETQLLSLIKQYGSLDATLKGMPDIRLQLSDGSVYETPGRIESISGVIDPTTGTTSLRAVFDNRNKLLHSGASGRVIIPVTYNGCIVIPQAATSELQDKTITYKVVDGKTVGTQIKVLPQNNGREYIVTEGLVPGNVIVAEGAGLLRDGITISSATEE